MSKALRVLCLTIGIVAIPVYVLDAKLRGRWDAEGVLLSVGLIALVLLEPPISFLVRAYFARRKERKAREEHERLMAGQRAREAEVLRKRLAREAAEDEAERTAEKIKAAEILKGRRQKVNLS